MSLTNDPSQAVSAGSRVRHRYDKNIQSAYKEDYKDHGVQHVEIVKPQHAFEYKPIAFTAQSTNKADFQPLEYSRRGIVPPMKASVKLGHQNAKFEAKSMYADGFVQHKMTEKDIAKTFVPYKGVPHDHSRKFEATSVSRQDFVRYNEKPRALMRPDNRSSLPLFDGPALSYETDNSAAFVPLPYAARKMKAPLQAVPLQKHKFTATSLYRETFPQYKDARPAAIARPTHKTEFKQAENRDWETEARANYHEKPYVAERHRGPKPAGITENHPFVGKSVSQESYVPLEYSRRGIVPPMKASVKLGQEGAKFEAKSMYADGFVQHKMTEKDIAKTFVPYKGVPHDHSRKFEATSVSRQDFVRYNEKPRALMRPDNRSSLPIFDGPPLSYETDNSAHFVPLPYAKRHIKAPLQAVPLQKHKFTATSLQRETFKDHGGEARPASLIKPDLISSHLW